MVIKNMLLAIALGSAFAGGVNAQTSKTKIEQEDSVAIMAALSTAELSATDQMVVESLLRHGNNLEGGVSQSGNLISSSQYGDAWVAYLENRNGGYYLVYEVRKPNGELRGKTYIKIG